MLVEFIKELPEGIIIGEVKNLPNWIARHHIDEGNAVEFNGEEKTEEKVKPKKKKNNEEI